MLSPGYFDFRWSWYRPIFNRGEVVARRCRVDVRRLPVRFSAEDGKEYIPYVVKTKMTQTIYTAMKRLQDYSIRYMIDGEKISAHQLPLMTPLAREMVLHLRKRYPHLPQMLLHHWCADEHGGLALLAMWQDMWAQSWKQDQVDNAPWVASVNILILKLIRQAIAQLPNEHEAHTDHVLVCVAGGLYEWALRNFLKKHVEGSVEVTRIATYEAMMIPATPIAFLYRQPEDAMLGDDRFVIMAYGLEPDIVPRLRALRAKVASKHEAGILALLAQDRMGEHMLRRSWTRLALWELAEKTGQGIWMQWVLNAKKLDQFLAKPELLPDTAVKLLESHTNYPLVSWILAKRDPNNTKASATAAPWLKDDRVLNAFRVFEEDVKVERTRRLAELVWMDRRQALGGKARGSEVEKILTTAWQAGELVYFQDAEESLHSGVSLSSNQACLRVEWADYLASMYATDTDYTKFLQTVFLPKLLSKIDKKEHVFLDALLATGCQLRGTSKALLMLGVDIQELLREFYIDAMKDKDLGHMPTASMCMTMMGEWTVVDYQHKTLGKFRLASSLAVTQADAAISHNAGIGQIISWRDHKAGRKPLGGVRVEAIDSGTGQRINVLHNQGFALSEAVVAEYWASMRAKARIKKFYLDRNQASSIFSTYRLASETFELVAVIPRDEDVEMQLFVKVGRPHLNGCLVDLYELLDPETEAAQLIRSEVLITWAGC
ncbi:MAG: hypothetical protein Q9M20_00305 [Mariprofundaceae bacterium]|nr:hypothetical protein [Mariprofundaceae bacterium]